MAIVAGGFVSAFIFYSLPSWKYGRGLFLLQMILTWIFISGWRLIIFNLFIPSKKEKEDVIIIGMGESGVAISNILKNGNSPYNVIGFLDDDQDKLKNGSSPQNVLGQTKDLLKVASEKGVNTAILAVTNNRGPSFIKNILDAKMKGIKIHDMPTIYERFTERIPVGYIYDEWLLFSEGFHLLSHSFMSKFKRLIDFGVSSFLLLLCLPILLATALAIRLDSKGPVLYKQKRVGKDGHVFEVYKFRSMVANAEENGAVWAGRKDSRITRVGKWIRLWRIDELPQLINIFRGEMSLIGPRPERPEFEKELEEKIPYYSIRYAVRPGISGWAQVNYPYGASVEDAMCKLEYDVYYIKNMSLLLDLRIMLKTIGVVILGVGAR